jgi:hypothetical protein
MNLAMSMDPPLSVPSATRTPCRGHLSFDDHLLGLNNQLASLSHMLCIARVVNACSLFSPPLGYVPCTFATHNPTSACQCAKTPICSSPPSVVVSAALQLPEVAQVLLDRGANQSARGAIGDCADGETSCVMCAPSMRDAYGCVAAAASRGLRVHVNYAWGIRDHFEAKRGRHPHNPRCPPSLQPLRLSSLVERYARRLLRRLGLVAGEYVAVQYRAGWRWRTHTAGAHKGWACYGVRTLNRSVWRRQLVSNRSDRIFVLTNANGAAGVDDVTLTRRQSPVVSASGRHELGVPVPLQILAELRVASLARAVLLNPLSSFHHAITSLRGGKQEGVGFVTQDEAIQGDHCECSAIDEPRARGARAWEARGELAKQCGKDGQAAAWEVEGGARGAIGPAGLAGHSVMAGVKRATPVREAAAVDVAVARKAKAREERRDREKREAREAELIVSEAKQLVGLVARQRDRDAYPSYVGSARSSDLRP